MRHTISGSAYRSALLISTALVGTFATNAAGAATQADGCTAATAGTVTCTPAGNDYNPGGIFIQPTGALTLNVQTGVTVTGSSPVENNSDAGIAVGTFGTPATFDTTINNNGTVTLPQGGTSDGATIAVGAFLSGNLALNIANTGDLTADIGIVGQLVQPSNGTSSITISNSGVIDTDGYGIYAQSGFNNDGASTTSTTIQITNTNVITVDGTDAFQGALALGIFAGATAAGTGTATVSVQNSANITSSGGFFTSGISVSGQGNAVTLSVVNSGNISAVAAPNVNEPGFDFASGLAADAVSNSGQVTITNTGTVDVNGIVAYGIAATARSFDNDDGTTSANVTVNNQGIVTVTAAGAAGLGGGTAGVLLVSSAVSTLNNSGTITSTGTLASVLFQGNGPTDAQEQAAGDGVAIPSGIAVLNNMPGGLIEGVDTVAVISGNQPTRITNSGRIVTDVPGGDAIDMGAAANILTLTPGSSITGFVINGSTDNLQPSIAPSIVVGDGQTFTVSAFNKLALGGSGRDTFNVGAVANTPAQLGYTPTSTGTQYQTNDYVPDTVHQYQGFSRFEKTGDSTWVLTGTTTNNGVWNVVDGTLVVNGSIANAPVNVGNTLIDPVIGGSGTVGNLTATAGGVVAPGVDVPYTTFHVNGNVSFQSGSVYRVAVNSDGRTDLLLATGTANLTGGTVNVLATGNFVAAQKYVILTANGGLGGTQFAGATVDSLFLVPTLSYDPNNVFLTVQLGIQNFGKTPNQLSAAAGAQTLPIGDPVVQALLPLDKTQILGALDSLSGEIHASAVTAGFEDTRLVREAILTRLFGADRDGAYAPGALSPFGSVPALPPGAQGYAPVHKGYDMPPTPMAVLVPKYTLWGQGFGDFGSNHGNGNAATLDRSLGGFVIGGDTRVDGSYFNNWRVGVIGGYTNDDIRVRNRGSSGSYESAFGGLYGSARYGALDLRIGATGGGTWTDTSRTIAFPGFVDGATAHYTGNVAQGFGELGYQINLARGFIEPMVGGAVIHIGQDSFRERGGPAALLGFGRDNDLETVTAGVRAQSAPFANLPIIARAMLGYRHAFGDVNPTALLAFESGSAAFLIQGAPIDRDALVTEIGVDYRAGQAWTVGVAYSGQYGDRADASAIKGKAEYRF